MAAGSDRSALLDLMSSKAAQLLSSKVSKHREGSEEMMDSVPQASDAAAAKPRPAAARAISAHVGSLGGGKALVGSAVPTLCNGRGVGSWPSPTLPVASGSGRPQSAVPHPKPHASAADAAQSSTCVASALLESAALLDELHRSASNRCIAQREAEDRAEQMKAKLESAQQVSWLAPHRSVHEYRTQKCRDEYCQAICLSCPGCHDASQCDRGASGWWDPHAKDGQCQTCNCRSVNDC